MVLILYIYIFFFCCSAWEQRPIDTL